MIDPPEARRSRRCVVFDLNNLNAKPMSLIPKFKTKFKKATSIIGFLNHLQGDLKLKAVEAGCDTVMPRSAFSQSLPNLLRRYGMEEEDEYIPQPMREAVHREQKHEASARINGRPFVFASRDVCNRDSRIGDRLATVYIPGATPWVGRPAEWTWRWSTVWPPSSPVLITTR